MLPTGTVTFLFTDIEGSTRLWEFYPDEMGIALARHDVILRQAIADHNGVVFKTMGDAFCVAFSTASDALQALLAAQQALCAEPWPDETPIRVRMALHTGLAEARDNDYFGQSLNRVARMLAAAHGQQALLSQAIFDSVQGDLQPQVTLQSLGECRLRDLARPEVIYQLRHPDLPHEFPPLRSLDNPSLPNNLPQQATSFIGREQELADVRDLLTKARLVTLLGPGGCGKTRLSLQVAADQLGGETFPDGAWLAEFAPLSDPALVPQTVAQIFGIREVTGEAIGRTLTNVLRDKRLLLMLDNCEHVLPTVSLLADMLLKGCPHVRLLATSREALNIGGEQAYRVPSLFAPEPTQHISADVVRRYESVRLFMERSQSLKRDFEVTDANAFAVAHICRQLDGIPLAIELAAARTRSMPVEQIKARLDDRFRLLTGGNRAALPRQQTLRAMIDWGYDLLTNKERRMMGRLSVFAGGWTLEAAQAVCAEELGKLDGGTVVDDVLDLLTTLADKSFVVYEQRGETEPRYHLLETIRQYGQERLGETEDGLAVKERHLRFFVALVEEAKAGLRGPEQVHWLNHLEMEHDNVRGALRFGLTTHIGPTLRICGCLLRFWQVRGYFEEGRRWCQEALAASENGGDNVGDNVMAERAEALRVAGILATDQGDYAAARPLHEECLALCRTLSDKQGIANALNNLGYIANEQGEYALSRSFHDEALSLCRELGDKDGIATALLNLGYVAYCQDDFLAARPLWEECLVLCRELGDLRGIARILNNLGNLLTKQNEYEAARALYQESLALSRTLANKQGTAYALGNLGSVAGDLGDYPAAQALMVECLHLLLEMGNRRGVATTLEAMAYLQVKSGAFSSAAQLCGAADSLRTELGSPIPPGELEEHQMHNERLQNALGRAEYGRLFAEGQAMTLAEACTLAFADNRLPFPPLLSLPDRIS